MVNGVLVERTVKDVLPTLKTNSEGLKQVIDDMLKQYKAKQTELDNWKVRQSLDSRSKALRLELYLTDSIPAVLTFLDPLQKKNNIQVVQP